MPTLKIPAMAIYNSGLRPEYYMAERLRAAGAPIEIMTTAEKRAELIEAGERVPFDMPQLIKRTGNIIQQDDKEKKNIIFSWEDGKNAG